MGFYFANTRQVENYELRITNWIHLQNNAMRRTVSFRLEFQN